jgi:hypothetical protein
MIIEFILKIYDYILVNICPFNLKQYQLKDHDDDDDAEYQDHFDEYTKLITITDQGVYNHDYIYYTNENDNNNNNNNNYNYNYNYNHIDNININRYPFKRSQSCNIPRYYCGYCCKVINMPEFMYLDKAFCTNNCRNNQILIDNKNKNKTRDHHSFSI